MKELFLGLALCMQVIGTDYRHQNKTPLPLVCDKCGYRPSAKTLEEQITNSQKNYTYHTSEHFLEMRNDSFQSFCLSSEIEEFRKLGRLIKVLEIIVSN